MLDVVILAAGMGTRMKSTLPKVLHPVAGRPMILEVLATARALEPHHCALVVGHGADKVRAIAGAGVAYALQSEQLGTGHAVMQARDQFVDSPAEALLVLYGDTPLIRAQSLRQLVEQHRASGAAVTLLSFLPDDSTGYGRILRDGAGAVTGIVEHKDATAEQRTIQESNSGIMLFDADWLWSRLAHLTLSPQGEYYLTDMVALASAEGRAVEAMVVDEQEVMGVNNRVQLAEASYLLWERRRQQWMLAGVTLVDPAAVWIEAEVTIGEDTLIHPGVLLRGRSRIGAGCEIGPNTVVQDATLGDRCRIHQAEICGAVVPAESVIEPFTVLRDGLRLAT